MKKPKNRVKPQNNPRISPFLVGMVVLAVLLVATVWLLGDRKFRVKADFLGLGGVEIEAQKK